MKDVSNHIEKMVTEAKKWRDGKPFSSEIKMHYNDNKKNKMMRIFYLAALSIFFVLLIIGITLFVIGGLK